MRKPRRRFWWALGLGFILTAACQNLNYACVGICGDTVGNGDFEGIISSDSLADAINQCLANLGCDAGFTPNCNCYLQEEASRPPLPTPE